MNMDPTAAAMVEIFLPDKLLNSWVAATNTYVESLLPPGRRQREITMSDILRFLATIQYMGVVKLPAKSDYFPGNRSDVLPIHPVIQLTKTRFDYLWRYFHTSYKSGEPYETHDEDDSEVDDDSYSEDEFKGRSAQTFRMKRKPDREGYKFFGLCCSVTGYVYSFFPDGRLDTSKTKVLDSVESLVSTLPRTDSLKYLLGMDNYFTLPSG
jgi:hypothetical protein